MHVHIKMCTDAAKGRHLCYAEAMVEETSQADRPTRPSSVRLDPAVQRQVEKFRRVEYRQLNNAVNILLIEALKARGMWDRNPGQDIAS